MSVNIPFLSTSEAQFCDPRNPVSAASGMRVDSCLGGVEASWPAFVLHLNIRILQLVHVEDMFYDISFLHVPTGTPSLLHLLGLPQITKFICHS